MLPISGHVYLTPTLFLILNTEGDQYNLGCLYLRHPLVLQTPCIEESVVKIITKNFDDQELFPEIINKQK